MDYLARERAQKHLLFYCRGLLEQARDCCSGRNIHLIKNQETALKLWIQTLERHPSDDAIGLISANLPHVAAIIHREYKFWIETQGKARHE